MVENETIRILHIVTYMGVGGLETMLMNVFRNIDREKVQFDFLVHRPFRANFDDEIEKLGGKIYRLPRLNPFSPRYRRELNRFFRDHPEYRIVHCHQDCLSAIPLAAAQKAGVPVRIAHSHTSNQDQNMKFLIKRHYMKKTPAYATHFFACGREAGEWMFPGQNVLIVNNGIDTAKFAFNPEVRSAVRRELGVQDKLVVGHVGSFVPTKNHSFLLEVFRKIQVKCPESVLLSVGNGPLEDQIHKKAHAMGLDDTVRFLGLRTDVNRLYQAMDVFVMPSIYEGFGIVAVEAQTSGLKCVLSDNMPNECKLMDTVEVLPLNAPCSLWADRILADLPVERISKHEIVAEKGYDIRLTAEFLQNFYRDAW